MKVFFTSDTHWGHSNIIKYDGRPFSNVVEMNETMVHLWNKVVAPEDTVYHLGDVSMMGWEKTVDLLNRLNGTKHLIKGNHDTRWQVRNAFTSCVKSLEVEVDGVRVFMQHVPAGNWPNRKEGVVHLHGHSHGRTERKIKDRYDVGCMLWGYKPVRLGEIMNEQKKDPSQTLK